MERRFKYRILLFGIISLVLLPILSIWYFNKKNAFNRYTVLEVAYWNEYIGKTLKYKYNFSVYANRNYTYINLTGNEILDKKKLDFAQQEIRKLVRNNDTINGVHFHFDDTAKYWTLVRAFDICKTENAKVFIPKDNDIWVFIFPSTTEEMFKNRSVRL